MKAANGKHTHRDLVVIVGGGLAGQRCAETLRRCGYEGAIRMVCAEPRRPYDRPPLSKELLLGAVDCESLAYRSDAWYEQNAVDLLLGARATALSPAERRLSLSTGATLGYSQLLIATGSRPRTLPILAGYANVSELRTLDDAIALRGVLAHRPRLAIVGAGFIGQEVAASARALGAAVTMIEAAAQPLEGVLGSRLGRWFSALHRAEGVDVLTRCTVERAAGNGRVERLYLSNGRVREVDHLVVGVGVQSDTEWLAGTPLATPAGVPVDQHGRTVDRRHLRRGGRRSHLRSAARAPRAGIALGSRRPAGSASGASHAGARAGRRADDELLDRSVRHSDPVPGPSPARRRADYRRRAGGAQLHRDLHPGRPPGGRPAGRPAALPTRRP